MTLASASVPGDVQEAFLRQACVEPAQVSVFREFPKYGGKRVVEVLEIAERTDLSKLARQF